MLRPVTRGTLNPTTVIRPQTALQAFEAAEGGGNQWYISYMTVANDHRRVIIRHTRRAVTGTDRGLEAERGDADRIETCRPITTAMGKRSGAGKSSDSGRKTAWEELPQTGPMSDRNRQLSATAALYRFSHSPRPPLPSSKDPLSDYLLGPPLGKGSFATVRKATHKESSTVVAIKTYEKSRLMDEQRKAGVDREIRILGQLNHNNVVKLIRVVEGPRQVHLVMEYVEGISLYACLKQRERRRLPEQEARDVFRQLMEGLSYLHEKGVAHRDLKLQNVLLDSKRTVKIIDFGFSTLTSPHETIKMYCGTPNYMAPEIIDRKEYHGAPADIWAAGVLLFTILCGEFPFKGLNDRDLYKRIAAGGFTTPPHVSTTGKELLAAMLALDPAARPLSRVVLTFPWVVGMKTSSSQPILSRPLTTPGGMRYKSTSILPNSLAGYDPQILMRLRNLGYTDATLAQELQNDHSHVRNLYQRLMEVKCSN